MSLLFTSTVLFFPLFWTIASVLFHLLPFCSILERLSVRLVIKLIQKEDLKKLSLNQNQVQQVDILPSFDKN